MFVVEEGVLTVVLCELCYHPVSGRNLCSNPCLKICFDLSYYEPLFLFAAPNLRKDSREIKVKAARLRNAAKLCSTLVNLSADVFGLGHFPWLSQCCGIFLFSERSGTLL